MSNLTLKAWYPEDKGQSGFQPIEHDIQKIVVENTSIGQEEAVAITLLGSVTLEFKITMTRELFNAIQHSCGIVLNGGFKDVRIECSVREQQAESGYDPVEKFREQAREQALERERRGNG